MKHLSPALPCLAAFVAVHLAAAFPLCSLAADPPAAPDHFADFSDSEPVPDEPALRQSLAQVPGERYEFGRERKRDRQLTRANGLFRLALPWPQGSALRLCPWETRQLNLYLWNGRRGIALRYYPEANQAWAAYSIERDDDKPRPSRSALWATDNGRYRNAGIGTFEVHLADGALNLSRGDLRLLSVPFDAPAAAVYLEMQTCLRGLAVVPSQPPPDEPLTRPDTVFVPARLQWKLQAPDTRPPAAPGYSFSKLADGRVELRAAPRTQQVVALTAIGEPELREVIFEIEDAAPGTGIVLADRDARERCRLAIMRHQQSQQNVFALRWPGSNDVKLAVDERRQILPAVGQRHWFRIVMAGGVTRLWISADGLHWSQPGPVSEGFEGSIAMAGLCTMATDEDRSIKLRALALRRLPAFQSLVPPSILRRAKPRAALENLEAWQVDALASQPPDIPAGLWRQACIVSALTENVRQNIGQPLLDRLLVDIIDSPADAAFRRAILAEATLFLSANNWTDADRLEGHWIRLARRLAAEGHDRALSLTSDGLLRSSYFHGRRLAAFPPTLLRYELTALAGRADWPSVAALADRLNYWNRTGVDQPLWDDATQHLVDWANAQSAASLTGRRAVQVLRGKPLRDALGERLSKEGYNTLAELRAALDAAAFREAATIIASASAAADTGLLPDRRDPRLLYSFALAVAAALSEHPPLQAAMEETLGPVGAVRLRAAAVAGDVPAVTAVAVQFAGTTAAAAARQWLGDRALARGRFLEAAEHYRAAAAAPLGDRDALAARTRLAAALLGNDSGAPLAAAVTLGSRQLTPGEFEEMIAQLKARKLAVASPLANPPAPPGDYTLASWATLDGSRTKRPAGLPDRGLDWPARQLAVIASAGRLFVNNQVDQLAFELATGRQLWAVNGNVDQREQQWALAPMRPVVLGEMIYVRRLAPGGPELACLGAADGKLVWKARPASYVASDPLLIGGELYVIAVSAEAGERLALMLAKLDPQTGRTLMQTPLADFADYWGGRLSCRAAVCDGRIVLTAAGALLACDAAGHVDWIRRQVYIGPPSQEWWQAAPWLEQSHEAPLAVGGRIYATQPGAWCVECVELTTGQLVWRQPVVGLLRIAALERGRLVVETLDGLAALDPATGSLIWQHDDRAPRFALASAASDRLLYTRADRHRDAKKPARLALVWLELSTGRLQQMSTADGPGWPDLVVGPLFAAEGHTWAAIASEKEPANREIRKLTPVPR